MSAENLSETGSSQQRLPLFDRLRNWVIGVHVPISDPNDRRDFGGMTFDLITEPDADFLLALPDQSTEVSAEDKKFFEELPGYVHVPRPVTPTEKHIDKDWA